MPDTIRTGQVALPPSRVEVEGTGLDNPGQVVGNTLVTPAGLTPAEILGVQDATERAVPSTICARGPSGECSFTSVSCDDITTGTIYSETQLSYIDFNANGEIVFRGEPRSGYGAREISGYTFLIGDLVPSAGYKGGYIVGKDLDGNLLFDWQVFGSGSPTGFLYWREAYTSIGWRVQMLSGSAGEGFVMESYNGADLQFDLVNSGAAGHFYVSGGGLYVLDITGDGKLAFFSGTPQAKPTITGSKGGNAALASLLTALANFGLITDSTT